MARNAEKAMTTLARWRAAQIQDQGKDKERRPYLASECLDLPKAEKWRMQIIREIAKKVAQIQNAGLGEFRIRDLNDEINKLLREKGHWEAQIRELGGPDYAKIGPRMLDHEGKEVPGNRGYKYFGAAKDLPGVRELFEQEPPLPPRKTRAELMKDIDADYYGYRDDDDGILIPLEQEAERKAIAEAIAVWKAKKEALLADRPGSGAEEVDDMMGEEEENIYAVEPDRESEDGESGDDMMDDGDGASVCQQQHRARFMAHVPVPSQKEVEAALLQRRKQELLERYASDDLMRQEGEAKSLLGVSGQKS
ncbi:pre-mRNA-splicing factor ISY1 homolog [Ischnura elegans]|uniref:pre-mRNA-splicing factor ISY1 homolog n=1 Tax=Ischnura elegans TaxID=197161 RepID=UPI001ED89E1C|nr:pre-mRNA-splicing factor ISY1 homolog [Ischnura elegans]